MAYLNKIDINGRTYYLQHLTDGQNEAMLPALEKDAMLIVQDSSTTGGNVGNASRPVYIEKNKVKVLSANVGNEAQFVYMKYGTITASTETVGDTTKPIYMNNGVMTEFADTVGSAIKPVYLDSGAITESNANVGSGVKPVYMNDGKIMESNETVGSDIKPVYLNAGAITVSNGNVGSEIIPVYMTNGTITRTTKTVGNGTKPIYMSNGTITASVSTVGAINQPVYMNNGEITACVDDVGNVGVPVYMVNGVITACGTIPITSGGTGAITKEKALENFGLTATAAELNTLDGITATVTELNYVDGVTSNIQSQFNDHEGRIDTIEAFFKEADIDASQDFIDTLKEIQKYITDDQTGAINMTLAIKGNTDAITKLNGDETIVGSVAKAVNDAKTALNQEIIKKVDKVDNHGLYPDVDKAKLGAIEAGANKYTHPSHTDAACSSGLYKITVDEFGHITNVVAVDKKDITDLDIPAQDTTYGVAVAKTETENGIDGLLSASDKAKYDKYETTIAGLIDEIGKLKELIKGYHPTTEPEEPVEPDETE